AQADRPFLVTEYITGPSLAEYVAEHGPLPGASVRALAVGLVEALVAIHGVGVVHRDLKPTNVILSAAGPKVIDFGIAAAADATTLTRTGLIIGSPGWVAPEQVTDGVSSPAVDIFTWGLVVAYAARARSP